jgi:TM2 domain-containing membrane protein YozV/uncharacterized tellurite resistance protein B-like protein
LTEKSKTVAGLLAIFLGSFGAHRFYVGQKGWGVVYLLFFWTYVPGILGLIEGFRYLLMSEEDFQTKYGGIEASEGSPESGSTVRGARDGGGGQRDQPAAELSVSLGGVSRGDNLTNEEKYDQSATAWVPPGQTVNVQERSLPGGMIYVGNELAGIQGYGGPSAALIDPSLDVDPRRLDPEGKRMSYWPSYTDIDAGCRATYLDWLAKGRRDPSYDIGYVFLYFYGLERRVFFDTEFSMEARKEIPQIIDEVEELLHVYGDNNSFHGYATTFLDAARARYQPEDLEDSIWSSSGRSRGLPLPVKIQGGQRIIDGDPIEGSLALAWFEHAPSTSLRTPGRRCSNEFRKLFLQLYQDKHGEGLVLEPNKTPLTVTYRPASRTVPSPGKIRVDDLPDISALSAPLRQFGELADECQNRLDSYSRHVGKTGDRESIESLALLPSPLLKDRESDALARIVQTVENVLGTDTQATTKLDALLENWSVSEEEDIRKRHLRSLSELLESLGYGIEPDVRFGAPTRGWGDDVVVFSLPEGESTKDPDKLDGIRLLQKLAVRVSLADGEITDEEIDHLSEHLSSALDLNERDLARLRAHRRWQAVDSPTLHGVRQRAEDLKEDQRQQVAKFLTTLACADAEVDAGEVEVLSKIYPMLGLNSDVVHTHLHELQLEKPTDRDEPVTVREADPGPPGYQIPEPGQEEADGEVSGVELDMEKVETTLEETEEVSSFLSDIFEDEEQTAEPSPEAPQPSEPATPELDGLDNGHAELLRRLAAEPEWERQQFEEIAEELNLFPDAAIEVINDYAFEQVEAPVIEGFDKLEVDQELCKEVMG